MQAGEILARDGAVLLSRLFSPAAADSLANLFPSAQDNRPGKRLSVSDIARRDPLRHLTEEVRSLADAPMRPVRAIAFDKTASSNWTVGWHQDRTIEVKQRLDTPGYGPWTVKQGRTHVSPPFAVSEAMLTVRVHIDRVDSGNAPLLIAPGSHRRGLVAEPDIAAAVQSCGHRECHAEAGDVWVYATPILHASGKVLGTGRRRVLQIDYAVIDLPNGLEWAADD
ncbi:phytanoyl-CoA dioxygenase family protein [Stakelama pacifica]|uniref:Phytanoyl-CoA dioxygenase PhyH n=1 Tax=Stakelama pacifica TaxID=517720 RepID=A0A4R6FY19_9SPHN|nr:phytanoyl-CoA dioxygenase family protein [Stakelama pacifica]TDN86707.1 phytanoyl-CoA dioxygenase PhyH [Stakelama pacifica]GGO90436.1 hypothetical protein GCM10011329_02760 [Stakelama pacifica]